MAAARMHPSLAKRFRTGRPCLDFLHTGGGGPDWVEPELAADQAGLERWLAHVLGLAGVRTQARDVAAAHRFRAALWRLVLSRTSGRPLAPDDVATVNAVASASPPVSRLEPDGTAAPAVPSGVAALSAVARDAIDLLTGPLAHRIRVCASDDCALLFVDASRGGTRRWCSMERCGNLAKMRTHRHAAPPGDATQG